jgi:4'-phosphopantetheinyl transferase
VALDATCGRLGILSRLLSDDERARAATFRFAADRTRYVVAHAALRTLIARYLGTATHRGAFHRGSDGKPALSSRLALHFNLAHSRDIALVALAAEREVGVDLEAIDGAREIEHLARRFFSSRESRALLELPSDRRRPGFFHVWSQKEAYLKGRGDGVAHGLDHFDVSPDPALPARLLADRRDPGAPKRWRLVSLDLGDDFRGAVAVEGGEPVLHRFEWQ